MLAKLATPQSLLENSRLPVPSALGYFALDAEAYFLNFELASGEARRSKQQLRRNQYGLVLSGPVVKNKTFCALQMKL